MTSKGTVIPLILLLGAVLLSAGPPQAFVLAQADPPPQARLPSDGLLDIPRLPVVEGADAPAAAPTPKLRQDMGDVTGRGALTAIQVIW